MLYNTKRSRTIRHWLPTCIIACLAAVTFSGCASTQKAAEKGTAFFPPPPNPPRVQFLKAFGNSRDVENKKDEFSLFATSIQESEKVKFITKPYGIATFGSKIYVTDTIAGKVAVVDLASQTFDWLKGDFGPGNLKKPVNVAVDKDGNLYVADTVRLKVLKYDPDGNFLRSYGELYDIKPVDVGVYEDKLYVLDFSKSDIKVFDINSGDLIESLGQGSENPEDNLSLPTNLAIDGAGNLFVSNITTGKIVKLDRDGHVLESFGELGDAYGQFSRPKGLAVDEQGRLYVVDTAYQNVQLFNEKGQLLMFFGGPDVPVGNMNLPAGITVSKDNLAYYQTLADPSFELEQVILVTNQVGDDMKVGIYGFGKKKGFDYDKWLQERQDEIEQARLKKKQLEEKERKKEDSK